MENKDPLRKRILHSASLETRDPLVDPCDSVCSMRRICERGAYAIDPKDPNCKSYIPINGGLGGCNEYIPRRRLTSSMKMGRRHNAHAQHHKSHAQRARELGLAVRKESNREQLV